jgi:hypothetical protein
MEKKSAPNLFTQPVDLIGEVGFLIECDDSVWHTSVLHP